MSLQLPKFPSKKNSLEVERENFEKGQATCLAKAINHNESAVKEKHVRSAIIGTYQERGASTFWECVTRLPLRENPIVCWKFCHVLHKVLREGHDNVIRDSQKYKSLLLEQGKFWGHLGSGYGGLVKNYCTLLHYKLGFHQRNNRIPGNLEMTDQQLRQCAGDSDDLFFQLSVEMFDYLDGILDLQNEILNIDSSKCNSMTNFGQCRLKPLISCIQDSMLLYDYVTKILFKLHAKLSPDLLSGHRERFLKVFKGLQQFYEKTMTLQYFKNLIEIQQLPKNPPNFLVQSDLENYETMRVKIYNSDRDITDAQSDTMSISDLVDLQEASNTNGSSSPDPSLMAMVYEKDRQIKESDSEIERLRMELQRLKMEAKSQINQLQFEVLEMKSELSEKTVGLAEKEGKLRELMRTEAKAEGTADLLEKSEGKVKTLEEKFTKMKDVYSNLRKEHIDLLRTKASVDKEVLDLKKSIDNQAKTQSELDSLKISKIELEALAKTEAEAKDTMKIQFEQKLKDLELNISTLKDEKMKALKQMEEALNLRTNEGQNFQLTKESLEKSNKELDEVIKGLQKELEQRKDELQSRGAKNEELDREIQKLHIVHNDNQKELEKFALERYNDLLNIWVIESEKTVKKVLESIEHPVLTGGSGCLDHFILMCQTAQRLVPNLKEVHGGYTDFNSVKRILENLPSFAHFIITLMINGSATSRSSTDIAKGDAVLEECRGLGHSMLQLFTSIRERKAHQELMAAYDSIDDKLKSLLVTTNYMGRSLTEEVDAADALDKELLAMESAIEEATKKMEEILKNSRASHTGLKLEVNEKLIDSCTSLMDAIRILVQKAKFLQEEIAAKGRGTASIKEFYKRNHQWTEGLISAAKSVGIGAKFLLESADKAVTNEGSGFEYLIASSQEIAASTIQLVIASQVRADRSSANLSSLKQASTTVKTATAHVVATAKDCAQLIEESDEMDFTKVTPHHAKRMELETQAEALRLQTELEKTRMKLAGLRQHFYHSDP